LFDKDSVVFLNKAAGQAKFMKGHREEGYPGVIFIVNSF
jgi:hypothetical protein